MKQNPIVQAVKKAFETPIPPKQETPEPPKVEPRRPMRYIIRRYK